MLHHACEVQQVQNTLHVLGTKKNLLSVGMLADKGCIVLFTNNGFWILTNTFPARIIAEGVRDKINGLYRLTPIGRTSQHILTLPQHPLIIQALSLFLSAEAELWHKWMGHKNYRTFHNLTNSMSIRGFSYLATIHTFCKECVMAKQTKTVAPKQSSTSASHFLELLHADLCGSFVTTSPGGSKNPSK